MHALRSRVPHLLVCLSLLAGVLSPHVAQSEELTYRMPEGRQFGFAYRIEAKLDDVTRVIQGVTVYRPEKPLAVGGPAPSAMGTGTAFVIHPDGYMLTCAHVVEGGTKIDVRLGEKDYVASVIGFDKPNDLAVLKIDAQRLPVLSLADSDKAELAEEVRAIGFPLSSELGESIKVTRGSIAGRVKRRNRDLLQVDAAVNPGNSGGPLLNDRGQVVGVVSAKLAGEKISNVGFAVPSRIAQGLLATNRITPDIADGGDKLDGPELVRQVVPSVGLVTVRIGPGGVGSAKRVDLMARGYIEVASQTKDRKDEKGESDEFEDVRVKVTTSGTVVEVPDTLDLPFGLGSGATVGLENLDDSASGEWAVQRIIAMTQVLPKATDRFSDAPFRERVAVTIPIHEVVKYEQLSTDDRGRVSLRKSLDQRTPHEPDEAPLMRTHGEGTLIFSSRDGMVEQLTFTGSLDLTAEDKQLNVPITYVVKRVDPSRAFGGALATLLPRATDWPSLDGPKVTQDERLAIPAAAERATALKRVREFFTKDWDAASTDIKKTELAVRLRDVGREEKNPTNRFALLEQSRRLAIDAQDLDLALDLGVEMSNQYVITQSSLEHHTLTQLIKDGPSTKVANAIAERALHLIEEALWEEDYDAVPTLGKIAFEASGISRDKDLQARVKAIGARYSKISAAVKETESARETLKQSPDDPDANLVVGKFYCFIRKDWDKGLPMLLRGSDTTLKEIARLELSYPGESSEQLKLADAWWSFQEQHQGMEQELALVRAVNWYRSASAQLSGLERIRVDRILKEHGAEVASDSSEPDKPELVGRKNIQAALIEYAGTVIQNKTATKSKEVGFTLGKQEFWTASETGGLLVGFDVSLGTFDKVTALRPIFLTSKGHVLGPVIGKPTRKSARVLATKGYAVGSIAVKGGIGIDGFAVKFMEITEGELNPEQSYVSPFYGKGATGAAELGGDGSPVLGIYGHRDDGSVMALGLIMAPKQE